ncbi:MAG: flagellar biosynthesis protein FlhB [Treponema sp.]|jgi:flagellar biosynthetic protein FlhB|nr:flagellar biosynthesis protein FlhB [Treponema sp.]
MKKEKLKIKRGENISVIDDITNQGSPRSLFTFQSSLFIHLQWFSDGDNEAEGRTEQPTEHKLQRLREEGQVVKSQELVGALGLFLPALLLLFLAPSMLRTCVEMVRFFFLRAIELDPTKDGIIVLIFLRYLVRLLWPILLVAVFAALFSNIAQTGFLFTTKPITPDFNKVVPRFGQFFKRIFSVEGIYNFFKSLIKMAIIGSVAFFLIRSDIEQILNLQKAGIWLGLVTIASLAIRMLLICGLLLLILAIPDYMFQRWRFRERHKMSRQEMKEEIKMYEADPQIQGRIRSRFRDLLRQNITASVPRADVVITNPTHLALALEYNQQAMPGPMVTAIGADEMAAKIRQIAEENGVPLVEDKPLAWALYRETNVGDIIPVSYWRAVATILSKVWHINELRRNNERMRA